MLMFLIPGKTFYAHVTRSDGAIVERRLKVWSTMCCAFYLTTVVRLSTKAVLKEVIFAFTRAINVFKTEYKLNENINLFQKNGFESLVLNCI